MAALNYERGTCTVAGGGGERQAYNEIDVENRGRYRHAECVRKKALVHGDGFRLHEYLRAPNGEGAVVEGNENEGTIGQG